MSGKQMEGDNQQRRARAREARREGNAPSEAKVTLGASKQRQSVAGPDRDPDDADTGKQQSG